MMPSWKGSDEVAALVGKKSRFLLEEGQEECDREEIVILSGEGEFRKVLSEEWPDR